MMKDIFYKKSFNEEITIQEKDASFTYRKLVNEKGNALSYFFVQKTVNSPDSINCYQEHYTVDISEPSKKGYLFENDEKKYLRFHYTGPQFDSHGGRIENPGHRYYYCYCNINSETVEIYENYVDFALKREFQIKQNDIEYLKKWANIFFEIR